MREGQWDVVFLACVLNRFLPLSMPRRRVCYSSVEWARLPKMRVRRRILLRSTRSTWSVSSAIIFSTTPSSCTFLTSALVPAHVFFVLLRYIVNAAKAAKVTDKDQQLIYVSVRSLPPPPPAGIIQLTCYHMLSLQVSTANPNSSIFYSRSKGLTEQALAELGYKDTVIFRPGALSNTNRSETRIGEKAYLYAFSAPSTPSLSFLPFVAGLCGQLVADSSLSFCGVYRNCSERSLACSLISVLTSKLTWVANGCFSPKGREFLKVVPPRSRGSRRVFASSARRAPRTFRLACLRGRRTGVERTSL